MTFEEEFRKNAEKTQTQLMALSMLDALAANVPKAHKDHCSYLDDTGWPAPCNCGFHGNQDVKTLAFMREAIMKA